MQHETAHASVPITGHRAAVVVPARNAARTLGQQLDALAPQLRAMSAEAVIVDDASTDGTSAVARRWADRERDLAVTVVRTEVRGGPNASRNRGLRATSAEIVCFTDGDDVVEPGWLEALVAAAERHPLVGGGYRILPGCGPGGDGEVMSCPFDLVGVPFPPGSCMAAQRSIIERVGGFDENIRRGGTEADFFVRAYLETGLTYRYAEGAVVGYRVEPGRRNAVRRQVSRARGQAYLSCRLRHERRLPAPVAHSLRASVGQLSAAARQIVKGPSRLDQIAPAAGATARLFWLAHYRLALPPPR